MSIYLRKYGTITEAGTHIRVPMVISGENNFATVDDWTPTAGDVKISKDGGALANIGTLPTFSEGAWEFQFATSELEAKQVDIQIVDSATKAVEDQFIAVETFGHASAMFQYDPTDVDYLGLTSLPTIEDLVSTINQVVGTTGVQLADDAIASAKYDESSAFPISSSDAGNTELARTGADGDTLETLSDQIDTISISGANALTVTVEDDGSTAISDARVQIRNADDALKAAPKASDENGEVAWNIENGTWTLQILADARYSWDVAEQIVTISDAAATATFTGTAVTSPSSLGRNLGNIITEVRDEVGGRGSDTAVLTNARITRWVNQAKDDVAQVWNTSLMEQRDSVSTADGTDSLDLGSALTYVPREILGVYIKDTTNEVMYTLDRKEHKDALKSFQEAYTAEDEEARPTEWSQVGMTLYWHKTPDAVYTAIIYYRYIPGDLTYSDGTETNVLTNYAANCLMAYATSRAYAFLEQPNMAADWMGKYQIALNQLIKTEGKRMTQGLTSEPVDIGSYRE